MKAQPSAKQVPLLHFKAHDRVDEVVGRLRVIGAAIDGLAATAKHSEIEPEDLEPLSTIVWEARQTLEALLEGER